MADLAEGGSDSSGADTSASSEASSTADTPANVDTTAAPAEPPAPKTSLEAAVLGLESTGLKLDQPLPADQVVRTGQQTEAEPEPEADPSKVEPAKVDPAKVDPADTPEKKGDDEDADSEMTEAELAQTPKGFRQRFTKLKQQHVRLKEQFASVQPAAQQFEKLQSFMASHELDARSAANALRIAALVQGAINGRVDPTGAVQELETWAGQLRGLAGDVLPADVQKRLDDGVIDEEAAKEIARMRAAQTTQARRVELDTQSLNTQALGAQATLIHSAVQTWEQAVRARDPDYPRKAKLVETTAKALRLERYGNGMPPSVAVAQSLAQEAYDIVTKELRAALPARDTVRSPLAGATPSKSTMRATPKSSLEAAIQGLERMGT
jgi:hypothetical protein